MYCLGLSSAVLVSLNADPCMGSGCTWFGVHVATSLLMPLSSFKGHQGVEEKDVHPGLILMCCVDMGRE